MNTNRDILYFQQHDADNALAIKWLHNMLYNYESIQCLTKACEIIDFNKLKVIKKKFLIEQILRQPSLKPFQFVNVLN